MEVHSVKNREQVFGSLLSFKNDSDFLIRKTEHDARDTITSVYKEGLQ